MLPASIVDNLSPYARVGIAVAPFAFAIFVRLILGNNQLTRRLISLSVVWFAANLLMAPYTAGMRQNIRGLRTLLPYRRW